MTGVASFCLRRVCAVPAILFSFLRLSCNRYTDAARAHSVGETYFRTSFLLVAVCIAQQSIAQTGPVEFVDASPPFRETAAVSMVQDRDGFIWIIDTWRLLKYDGYTYKRYYNGGYRLFDVPVGLAGIAGGKNGILCITASVNRLLFVDTDRYESRFLSLRESGCPGDHEIDAVMEDSRGHFWIGSRTGHVFRIDPRRMKVERVFECDQHDFKNTLGPVRALAEDSRGSIWIGGESGLLIVPDAVADSTLTSTQEDTIRILSDERVAGLLASRDGRMWVCSSGGMVAWVDPENLRINRILDLPLAPTSFRVRSLIEDLSGDLWIATSAQGLYQWRATEKKWERHLVYRDASGHYYPDGIRNAIIDRTGILWVMTSSRGLIRHLPGPRYFQSYTAQGGGEPRLSGEDISAAFIDRMGTLWVGRGSGGLDYLPPGGKKFGRFVHDDSDPDGLSSNSITCITELHNGELWIGTVRGGISVFNQHSRSFKSFMNRPGDLSSIGSNDVFVVYQDSHGRIWVGHAKGVDRYNAGKKTFESVLRWPEETTGHLGSTSAIIEDSRGNIWIGTQNKGLLRMNPEGGDTVWYRPDPSTESSLPYEHVTSVFQDAENRLWVGTTLSLSEFEYESDRFDNYEIVLPRSSLGIGPGAPPPPIKQGIYGIVGDRLGDLWVWLQGGIVARFDVQDHTFRRFGRAEGVVPTAPRPAAFFRTNNGTIYCGGPGGITWFHPDSIPLETRSYEAPLVISQFRVFQQPRPLPADTSEAIVLSDAENTCSFEFAMLDFRGSEEFLYQYMLEGLDNDWSMSSPERTVSYVSLPPGQYRFRVQAANGNGVWSSSEASVQLIVEPPYWQTWWFRILGVITLGLVFYGVYRYRMTRALALERLRLRIAGDLHDEIGSNLSGIALEGDVVAGKESLPDDIRMRLHGMTRLARESSQSMRDIVWLINPEHDTFGDLLTKMRETANSMLSGMSHTFQTRDGMSGASMDLETKRTIFLMYKEVLHNIVKHSKANVVCIEVSLQDGHFRLKVRDDGIGFSDRKLNNGEGLKNLRRRASQAGGRVEITSLEGDGTTVEMEIRV